MKAGEGGSEEAVEEVHYKIEVPANRFGNVSPSHLWANYLLTVRYDILCVEGLARALRIFLQKEEAPTYTAVKPHTPERMVVHQSVSVLLFPI